MTGRAKTVCVLIRSDPRSSHRPCEALRLALGLASGGHRVELILVQAAPFILTAAGEEAIDGEQARIYLRSLKTFIPALLIDIENPGEKPEAFDLSELGFETIPLTKAALAERLGRADALFSF